MTTDNRSGNKKNDFFKITTDLEHIHKFSRYTDTVHFSEPNYERESFKLNPKDKKRLLQRLTFLYGEDMAEAFMPELERVLKVYYAYKPQQMIDREKNYRPETRFTEEDIILITYGDLLVDSDPSPLATLARFCDSYLKGTINTLHILPFFPYSSDRGFSVIDFETVDPRLGTWEDIEQLENKYQLMFDGVFNHVSAKSRWFELFRNGHPYYKDFFTAYKSSDELPETDRKQIFRPRTTDILQKFHTIEGPRYVWATFSDDQLDLNYKNPNVLIRVLEILLLYARHGADIIRLDAVTYLWTEPGTRCIHLEQTHEIVKLFREILDIVAPGVAIITETNVPHEENISYFGNGQDEAHMVYNFALPPLVLYSFYSENSEELTKWAATLETSSATTTFFNFLDSHDGVGLMGVRDILNKDQLDYLIKNAEAHGGLISHKTSSTGNEEPYEINITWFSALNIENDPNEDIAYQVKRFIASRTIALVIPGVPGIYLHGLIGTPNDIEAVKNSNTKRDINRTVLSFSAIIDSLNDPLSKISRINRQLGRILKIRTQQKAFHPCGSHRIFSLDKRIFAIMRVSPDKEQRILALINISNSVCYLNIPADGIRDTESDPKTTFWFDIISEMDYWADSGFIHLTLNPYDIIWLEQRTEDESE